MIFGPLGSSPSSFPGHVAALNILQKAVKLHTVPYFWSRLKTKSIRYAGTRVWTLKLGSNSFFHWLMMEEESKGLVSRSRGSKGGTDIWSQAGFRESCQPSSCKPYKGELLQPHSSVCSCEPPPAPNELISTWRSITTFPCPNPVLCSDQHHYLLLP